MRSYHFFQREEQEGLRLPGVQTGLLLLVCPLICGPKPVIICLGVSALQRIGEVTAVRGDTLEITFCKPEECASCHGCDGHSQATVITVKGQANLGDAAIVEMPDQVLVKASVLGYVLPVTGLLGGMAIGYFAVGGDIATAVGGVIGLGLCATIVMLTDKKRRDNPAWQPVLQKILPKETLTRADRAEMKGEL